MVAKDRDPARLVATWYMGMTISHHPAIRSAAVHERSWRGLRHRGNPDEVVEHIAAFAAVGVLQMQLDFLDFQRPDSLDPFLADVLPHCTAGSPHRLGAPNNRAAASGELRGSERWRGTASGVASLTTSGTHWERRLNIGCRSSGQRGSRRNSLDDARAHRRRQNASKRESGRKEELFVLGRSAFATAC